MTWVFQGKFYLKTLPFTRGRGLQRVCGKGVMEGGEGVTEGGEVRG